MVRNKLLNGKYRSSKTAKPNGKIKLGINRPDRKIEGILNYLPKIGIGNNLEIIVNAYPAYPRTGKNSCCKAEIDEINNRKN